MPSLNNLVSKLKTIENKLRRDANLSGQIDYNEQISWMLFLKVLDDLESRQEKEALLENQPNEPILEEKYRWSSWVKKEMTAQERYDFVKNDLFPYLRNIDTTLVKKLVAQVFEGIPTKIMQSPYGLAEVLDLIDSINLANDEDSHIVSQFYEESLQKMGSAGRQAGGEFYTPRPVIRLILKMINPEIGETILDPFMGSAGFLAEGYKFLHDKETLTTKEYEILQHKTFSGQELKPIPFLLGVMNCILHGLYGAKFLHKNSFSENIRQLRPEERVDVVITNPPFGAEVEPTLLQNFPFPTSSSQVLAVQYILRRLKPNGKCGMVVDEGFLSRVNEKAFLNTKKELLEENKLFAIVSLPQGAFTGVGTGVKTNLMFFEKGKPTKGIWYYELTGKFTKTRPVTDKDFEDCWKKFQEREVSDSSWLVKKEEVKNYDLTAKNPNGRKELFNKSPKELIREIKEKEGKVKEIMVKIDKLI